MSFKAMRLASIAALVALLFQHSDGSPFTISDERVRKLDVTPVLGRGYSIGTDSFHSTCLIVDDTTPPSYNYDYTFTDFTKTENTASSLAGHISGSFGYGFIKATVTAGRSSSSSSLAEEHYVTATMRIERYYSSLKEESSKLSDDAKTLLDRRDYIGFFKGCGPNYIRSIRRAQEVTAIFKFKSESKHKASAFAASLQANGWGQGLGTSLSGGSSDHSSERSLQIMMKGYGMGLNEEGSDTLVATSLQEYNQVMKFAFKSMTQSKNSAQIGMIYGIELVPWVDNTAFQVAAAIHDTSLHVPVSSARIPKVQIKWHFEDTETLKAPDDKEWPQRQCRNRNHVVDKNNKCCEENQVELVPGAHRESLEQKSRDYENLKKTLRKDKEKIRVLENELNLRKNGNDDTASVEDAQLKEARLEKKKTEEDLYETEKELFAMRVCKPMRQLDPSVMKNNMVNNGEFVAMLDSTLRSKINIMYTVQKCINAVNSFPPRFDNYLLEADDTVKYDDTIETKVTVKELRMVLDPMNDSFFLAQLGAEIDEFVSMFYEPCLDALYGFSKIGEIDESYFMMTPWMSHNECKKLSCLADSTRWDSKNGNGCIPSLLMGKSAVEDYVGGDNDDSVDEDLGHCAQEYSDDNSDEATCKITNEDRKKLKKVTNKCWKNTHAAPHYLVDHFCMPELTGHEVPDVDTRNRYSDCTKYVEELAETEKATSDIKESSGDGN